MAHPTTAAVPTDADIHLDDDITDVLQLLDQAGEKGVERILELMDSLGGLF